MAHEDTDRSDRRSFLQAGAVATAGALSVTSGSDCARHSGERNRPSETKARQDRA